MTAMAMEPKARIALQTVDHNRHSFQRSLCR